MIGVADLLDGRATPAALDLLRAHRDAGPALERLADAHTAGGPTVADAVAAEAYSAFGRGVFPYAGVFLDDDGGARGALVEVLRRGPPPPPELGAWLPMFVAAVRDLDAPVPTAVADALAGLRLPDGPEPELVEPPDPEAEGTDLRAIADHLCRPARCGIFLSAPVIERIARNAGVPRGFGDRRRILAELLRNASRFDTLDAVFEALAALAERHGRTDPRAARTAQWLFSLQSRLH